MDHLYEVTSTVLAYPVAARAVSHLCADLLEDGRNDGPCSLRTAGHQGRTLESAFLSTRNAGTDVEQTFALNICSTTVGVGIVGVTAVDDDVAGLQQRDELVDEIVDSLTCLHHKHHLARTLQRSHKVFERHSAVDVLTLGAGIHEIFNFRYSAVEDAYAETFALHVEHQVLTHHRQADKANV